MNFTVWSDGFLDVAGARVPCALGAGGVVAASVKREGDGASPAGLWPLRKVFWRPDRQPAPATGLPVGPIGPDDGWCDDPADPLYNRLVRLPWRAGAERLWRADVLYDLLVVLGHNDSPPVPGAGSAIFLHVTAPEFAPTRGCVALRLSDLIALLALAAPGDALDIRQAASGFQP